MKTSHFLAILSIVLIFLLPLTATAQGPLQESSSRIGIDVLKPIFVKLNQQAGRDQTALAIQNKNDVKRFLKFLMANDDFQLTDSIRQRLERYDEGDDLPILFVWHPIDTKRMMLTDDGKADSLFAVACAALNGKKTLRNALSTKREGMIGKTGDKLDAILADANAQRALETLNVLLKNVEEELPSLLKNLEDAGTKVVDNSSQIIENKDKTENILLNIDDKQWSDYLLSKDQFMVVILGGKDDLANATIKIDNKPTAFEQSFNELTELAKATDIPLPGLHDAPTKDCAEPKVGNQDIPIKFMLTRAGKVRAPTTISVTEEKTKLDLKIENHERVFVSFKVGVAAANIDRKIFNLDSANNLTIAPDTAQKKEWKSNLMVMLDIYPWGRDIDRLDPIWKKSKRYGMLNMNRFGIAAGLKLSKDPLERTFAGVSYAISKELSITGGVAFDATPKDVESLPVGNNATLEYLKDNAGRELKPSLYFGISLSPAAMGKTLGLIK